MDHGHSPSVDWRWPIYRCESRHQRDDQLSLIQLVAHWPAPCHHSLCPVLAYIQVFATWVMVTRHLQLIGAALRAEQDRGDRFILVHIPSACYATLLIRRACIPYEFCANVQSKTEEMQKNNKALKIAMCACQCCLWCCECRQSCCCRCCCCCCCCSRLSSHQLSSHHLFHLSSHLCQYLSHRSTDLSRRSPLPPPRSG